MLCYSYHLIAEGVKLKRSGIHVVALRLLKSLRVPHSEVETRPGQGVTVKV